MNIFRNQKVSVKLEIENNKFKIIHNNVDKTLVNTNKTIRKKDAIRFGEMILSRELFSNYNENIFAELNKGKKEITDDDEEKKANLMSQKKVDEFLLKNTGEEADYDEVKQIEKQMKFLKKELKETRALNEQLSEQVKELIKNIKCDSKNKLQINQICQLLNF